MPPKQTKPSYQDKIDRVFNEKPCVRCNSASHSLWGCSQVNSFDGSYWETMSDELWEKAQWYVRECKRGKEPPSTNPPREWTDGKTIDNHELYYPNFQQFNFDKATLKNGKAWDGEQETSASVAKNNGKLEEPLYPQRKELLPLPPNSKSTVFTNHFELKIKGPLYKYEILGLDGEGRSKRKIKELFNALFESWPLLQDNRDCIAADGLKTIVSWKRLRTAKAGDTAPDLSNLRISASEQANSTDERGMVLDTTPLPFGLNGSARLSFVEEVDIAGLRAYSNANLNAASVQINEALRCLNILICRSFDRDVVQTSSNKFFIRKSHMALFTKQQGGIRVNSLSLELLRGYFFTVKPGMGNLLLNFNLATSAFLRPILVSEFLRDNATFTDVRQRHEILIGKRVYIEYTRGNPDDENYTRLNSNQSRIKRISGFCNDIAEVKFSKNIDGEVKEVWVANHLSEVLGTDVIWGRKGVNVSSKGDAVWYAQEHLRILPYQVYTRPVPEHLASSMVEHAALAPHEARRYVECEGLQCLGLGSTSNETPIRKCSPISLFPTMLRAPSECLDFPRAKYKAHKNGKLQDHLCAGKSNWSLRDVQFLDTKTAPLRYLLIHDNVHVDSVNSCKRVFEGELWRCGINKTSAQGRVQRLEIGQDVPLQEFEAALEKGLAYAAENEAGLVILALRKPDVSKYTVFKNLTDRKYRLQSICVTVKSNIWQRDDKFRDYMTNVMMKVNLKRGGINHTVNGLNLKDTMVLGADVVHPGPGSAPGCPSIASIVGSVDDGAGKCLGSMRIQHKEKTDREIIDNVYEMVVERLRDWLGVRGKNAALPKTIIYYRDGTSEGQYDKIKDVEVPRIREAFEFVKKDMGRASQPAVNIVAVVGGKRHHTRFYPTTKDGEDTWGNNNCKPGTTVDRLVTSPYYQDFYLQSHSGIKGTARPTHYFVVVNDKAAGYDLQKLRQLTHNLCYTYCRAHVPVSYASPTYYADRLCERGRLYLRKFFVYDESLRKILDDKKGEAMKKCKFYGKVPLGNADGSRFKMTDEQRKLLEKERKEVEKAVDDTTMKLAAGAFYEHVPKDPKWGNPWSREVGKVMFWM